MRGRYLWQKLELLLSFFLLAPLWSALAWLVQQVSCLLRHSADWPAGVKQQAVEHARRLWPQLP